jgi:Xaa-Pro aminopeptidase
MTREKLMNEAEFQRRLAESGLDAVVAVSQTNVIYTSGAVISTQTSIPDRLAMTLLPKDGEDAILVCNIERGLVRHESWIDDVRYYREFVRSPMDLLVEVLRERGLANGRIGIEKRYLTAAYHEQLLELLPEATIVGCDDLFEQVRSIKTKGEIDKFGEVNLAAERAIIEAFEGTKPGDTDKDLLELILDKVAEFGANDVRFAIVGTGEQSHLAHPEVRSEPLRPGDLVRVDIGADFSGYCSDVARMAVVGEPSDEQKEMYRKHRAVERGAIAQLKPGVRACEVYQYCVDAYAKAGIDYGLPHVGHGFGLAGHEFPMLQPYNTAELCPNMLICVEPAYWDDSELGGYQIEDLVLVTDDVPEILTTYSDTEDLFMIQ